MRAGPGGAAEGPAAGPNGERGGRGELAREGAARGEQGREAEAAAGVAGETAAETAGDLHLFPSQLNCQPFRPCVPVSTCSSHIISRLLERTNKGTSARPYSVTAVTEVATAVAVKGLRLASPAAAPKTRRRRRRRRRRTGFRSSLLACSTARAWQIQAAGTCGRRVQSITRCADRCWGVWSGRSPRPRWRRRRPPARSSSWRRTPPRIMCWPSAAPAWWGGTT